MKLSKSDWLTMIVFIMLTANFVWTRYEKENMKTLVSEVCLSGLKVAALQQRSTFFQIEAHARDEKQAPKMNLADIANLAKDAQRSPDVMDQAIERFVECSKIGNN